MSGSAALAMPRLVAWIVGAVAAMGLAGCSPSLAVVEGKLSHNGQPVASSEVALISVDDPNQQFFGASGSDGRLGFTYRGRDGAPPGRYTLRVTHATLPDGKPLPEGEDGARLLNSGEALIRNYVFEQNLIAGPNQLDLKLENARVEAPGKNHD